MIKTRHAGSQGAVITAAWWNGSEVRTFCSNVRLRFLDAARLVRGPFSKHKIPEETSKLFCSSLSTSIQKIHNQLKIKPPKSTSQKHKNQEKSVMFCSYVHKSKAYLRSGRTQKASCACLSKEKMASVFFAPRLRKREGPYPYSFDCCTLVLLF